ncbi:MAG: EamA family transporter [Candidatus Terrybacteria bacterium]|nr:EamA family transporter [Candidatus Terrybacteria bacterium]
MWFLFSFLTAFFESLKDVVSKKNLKNNVNEYVVAWSMKFFAVVLLTPVLFLFFKIPQIGNDFWWVLLVGGSLNVVAAVLIMKALKYSDMSLVVPMIAFTPVFLLLTSPLMLGEWPNFWGVMGILLIVLGSYILHIKEKKDGYFAPFKALIKERGARLMLLVAFIWSITSNFDKIGVINSSPIFWVFSTNTLMALVLLPIMMKQNGGTKQIISNFKSLMPVGFFNAVAQIFQMTAINMTLVAYVISIKRTSVIMGVLFGALIFKEKGLKERLLGAVIMVMGVILILFTKSY